tara:strand:- start:116 stop:898 length:783 start_codon:yes stop_codon:yes gene_type:complete
LKDHIYTTTGVVVGGNLNALLYAHKKNYHIIINSLVHAAPYDTVGHEAPLAISKDDTVLYAANLLRFDLSMRGLCLFGTKVSGVSVNLAESEILISSNFFSPKKMRFSKLYVFDSQNVSGLPFKIPEISKYRVLDWFDVRSGSTHDLDDITDPNSDFVNKIKFLPSRRIKGANARNQKDLIAESIIKSKDINEVEYSHSFSRMKSSRMMTEAGICPKKGINLELRKREIFPFTESTYIQNENVVYCDVSTEEVIDESVFT